MLVTCPMQVRHTIIQNNVMSDRSCSLQPPPICAESEYARSTVTVQSTHVRMTSLIWGRNISGRDRGYNVCTHQQTNTACESQQFVMHGSDYLSYLLQDLIFPSSFFGQMELVAVLETSQNVQATKHESECYKVGSSFIESQSLVSSFYVVTKD